MAIGAPLSFLAAAAGDGAVPAGLVAEVPAAAADRRVFCRCRKLIPPSPDSNGTRHGALRNCGPLKRVDRNPGHATRVAEIPLTPSSTRSTRLPVTRFIPPATPWIAGITTVALRFPAEAFSSAPGTRAFLRLV